jgi:hypothetical protein
MMTNYALKVGMGDHDKKSQFSRPSSSFKMNPNISEPLIDAESLA